MHPSHAARLRHRRHQLRLILNAGHEGLQVLPSNGSGRLSRHRILKASAEFFVGQRNNNRSVPFHGRRKKSSGGEHGAYRRQLTVSGPGEVSKSYILRVIKRPQISRKRETCVTLTPPSISLPPPSISLPPPPPEPTSPPLSPTRTPSQSEQYVEYIGDRRATPRVKKDKTEKKVRRQKCPNIPGGEELSASL